MFSGEYVWWLPAYPHQELRQLPPGSGDSPGGSNTNWEAQVSVDPFLPQQDHYTMNPCRSENLSIIQDEVSGTTIKTITREIKSS